MPSESFSVNLSAIDEERFGIRSARATYVTLETLPSLMDFCRKNSVVFLIARCLSTEIHAVQEMEREGFLLMDTLICYKFDLKKTPIPPDEGKIIIRPFQPGEEDVVRATATDSFREYYGHYHSDKRLDRAKCDEVYSSWAYRSCTLSDVANEVLVADEKGSILGFASLRATAPEEVEWNCGGVVPSAHRKGVFRSLCIHSLKWALSQGANCMVQSTVIPNLGVQKTWLRLGFEPTHAFYTFHKWFDEQ
ncbi:MAG: GNAT family N-acetyltransferase [bacterium]